MRDRNIGRRRMFIRSITRAQAVREIKVWVLLEWRRVACMAVIFGALALSVASCAI